MRTLYADDRRLVTAREDGTVRLFDTATGRARLVLKGHPYYYADAAAFSPDGRRIVTAAEDGTPRVWDARTGKELLHLREHTARTLSVGFSPDGRRIITGGADRTAKVWDALTGRELLTLSGPRMRWCSSPSPPTDGAS